MSPDECVETEPATAWLTRWRGPWFALAWLPLLLAAPVAGALAERQFGRTAYLVLLGLTYAATVWLPYRTGGRHSRRSELMLLLLGVVCVTYLVIWRTDRMFIYPLLAIATATAVRPRWTMGVVGSLAVSGAVATGLEDRSVDSALALAFATFLAGTATFLVHHLVGVVAELTRTRERLARMAVSEERSRFARDLHDLLGHTLSVIVVKAQAIRRLVDLDPAAAAAHAKDVETVGRQALTEVRDAVTGYRTVRLSDELSSARNALAAANIRVDITQPAGDLPTEVDAVFGWVVREATTNVLRHAAASQCRITVTIDEDTAGVEVIDDGHGASMSDGSGLRGLRERVDDLGGDLIAAATPTGFRLAVRIPVVGRR
jgi:two-component system sensor histidine kinase DesK